MQGWKGACMFKYHLAMDYILNTFFFFFEKFFRMTVKYVSGRFSNETLCPGLIVYPYFDQMIFYHMHIITPCSHVERIFSVVDFQEERAIVLRNDTSGFMYRLNYPSSVHFPKLRYKQRLVTAIGHNIQLQFNHVVPAQSKRIRFLISPPPLSNFSLDYTLPILQSSI